MSDQIDNKTCFIIAPIGEEDSAIRKRSDQILKHVLAPVTNTFGYKTVRADQISDPGIITSQVIQHLLEDELVIADLTGHNPNVFYELAIRHTTRKPVIQLIQAGEDIPFDVAQSRTILIDLHDLDNVANCKAELSSQINSIENDALVVESPISVAIDLQVLRKSDNPLEKSNAEILELLTEIRGTVNNINTGTFRKAVSNKKITPTSFRFYNKFVDDLIIDCTDVDGTTIKKLLYYNSSFQDLLDNFYVEFMHQHVKPYTYGKTWILLDGDSKSKYNKIISDGKKDDRTLKELGIIPGHTLLVKMLNKE